MKQILNKGITILSIFSFLIFFGSCNKNSGVAFVNQKSEFIDIRNATNSEIQEFRNIVIPFYGLINKIDSSIDTNNILFDNLKVCKVNNKSSEALIVELRSNNKYLKYALTIPVLNSRTFRPLLESISNERVIKYYDLENADFFTLNIKEGQLNIEKSKIFPKSLEPKYISTATNPNRCSWQGVNDCIQDAYANHGFLSTWLWIQSAYLPHTAAAIGAFCIMENVKCDSY